MNQWKLTSAMVDAAAGSIGVDPSALQAVCDVESAGSGFLKPAIPKILFEGHVFWRELVKRKIDPVPYAARYPDIIYKRWTKEFYKGGSREYDRLHMAEEIHAEAALCSCSWGTFQIMGFNHTVCGFASVFEFVDAHRQGAEAHLDCFIRFLQSRNLIRFLRQYDWAGFAYGYNGSGYAKNAYDRRLKKAFLLHKSRTDG